MNTTTRQLLYKDLPILLFFLLGGLLVQFLVLSDTRFVRLWCEPHDHLYETTSAFYFIAAAALGVVLTLREEAMQTREYLWHRPVGVGHIVGTRHVGAALVMLAWAALPFGASLIFHSLFNADAVLMDRSRILHYLAIGSMSLPIYAAACFAATLSRRLPVALLLSGLPLAALGIGWLGFHLPMQTPLLASPGLTVLLHIGLAIPLGCVAYVQEKTGTDPDLPLPSARVRLGASVVVVTTVWMGAIGIGATLAELEHELRQTYPMLGQTKTGGYMLLQRAERAGKRVFVASDQKHQPRGEIVDRADLAMVWSPDRHRRHPSYPRSRNLDHRGKQWQRLGGNPHVASAWLEVRSGLVVLLQRSDVRSARTARRRSIGRGPENAPFSTDVRTIQASVWSRYVALADSDGSIWILDTTVEEPAFERVPLPQDDRFVATFDLDDLRSTQEEQSLATFIADLNGERPFAIRGHHGIWIWNGKAFAPLPENLRQRANEVLSRPPGRRWEFEVEDKDPLHYHAVLRDGNRELYRHDYAPRTWFERALAGALLATSLLRSPPLQLIDHLHAAQDRSLLPIDPLTRHGRRTWLIGLNLALVGVCIGWSRRRLRRLGAGKQRIWLWTLAIAITGTVGLVICRLLETNRAWRATRVAAIPPPLIATRASA